MRQLAGAADGLAVGTGSVEINEMVVKSALNAGAGSSATAALEYAVQILPKDQDVQELVRMSSLPESARAGIVASIERRNCEQVFLRLLDKTSAEEQPVSSNTRSGNYAPRLFSRRPDRERFQKPDFEWAMQALFAVGEITNEPYGRKGDLRFRIARRQQREEE